MNKVFLSILFLFVFVGCTQSVPNTELYEPKEANDLSDKNRIIRSLTVVEIEGHEYFVRSFGRQGGMCHKANCKYCTGENVNND